MNKESSNNIDPSSIERLSHYVVSNWVDLYNISLRPADKAALKKMMCQSIPAFILENQVQLCERYMDMVKEMERQACIDAISNLEEPISGLINKQRTLNLCTYSDSAAEVPLSSLSEKRKSA